MNLFYTADRTEWRKYLETHFETSDEIWFVFPTKTSGEPCLSYNDTVEEALCFGWIDGRAGSLDETALLKSTLGQDIDAELLLTAAALHDIGKLDIYKTDDIGEATMTLQGYALGSHHYDSLMAVEEAIREGMNRRGK